MVETLLSRLRQEQAARLPGGIYHRLQILMTYNSNHIEGSRLTEDQTRSIFETHTITADGVINIDDIAETQGHFRAIDLVIQFAEEPLSQTLIKDLHRLLKENTSDAKKDWFGVGAYKKLPNEVGLMTTTEPDHVEDEVCKLIADYESRAKVPTLEDLLSFHVRFERIHPFQDGNGRVGRLVLLKECLRYNIVPPVITEDLKHFYYRGLSRWDEERGFLIGTAQAGQDQVAVYLDRLRVPYQKFG